MALDETAPELPTEIIPASSSEPMSLRDAANATADYRNKRDAKAREPEKPEAPAKAAEPETPSAEEAEASPQEEAPGEQTETTEPESLPPIEPPRSWTKEDKAEFSTYPREAQEKIARREQDREAALRRGQNETAEQRKGLDAERQKVEQARQQYEQALPALLQTLNAQQQGEFSDIKSMEDVTKLAREDWPRYALWDAQQKKIAAVTQEVAAANERQTKEYETQWSDFASKEDAKFIESHPELADTAKPKKIADASVAMLRNVGFTDSDLSKSWQGKASWSPRDSRVQTLIMKAALYDEAQTAIPKAAVKTIPQVLRPGSGQSRGTDADLKIKNLDQQLERSGNWKDAVALLVAQRSKRK